ncbi:MAG: family 20 glycosylhydrolase, partial [Candidatus Fimimonas sp.]
ALTPLRRTYKFNPLRGVKKSKRQNVLGVEGTVWTEYIATTEKLFFNLLPRMLALSEVAWGTNTGEFAKRCNAYTRLYDKMGLTHFKKATVKVHKRVRIVQRFFRQNPNVELDAQKNGEQQKTRMEKF